MLLNPLPIYGLLMGIFGLGVALTVFRDSRTARTAALMLVCIGAISFGPVMHYGEAGYDRAARWPTGKEASGSKRTSIARS